MGNPVFKFTLSHTPKASVSTSITLPSNTEGENVAGAGADWSTGLNPTVTVSGSPGSQQSDIWANEFAFATGLSYTINYSIGYNINVNATTVQVRFVALDVANNVLTTDIKNIPGTGTGTLSESSTFTARAGSVKYGFFVTLSNLIGNAGSTFDIDNGITGSVATIGESGSPSSVVITEPIGWKDSKLKMERHPDFHSLVEYFETGLTYYGENNVDNGGIDFLKSKEQQYGFDTTIEETVEADIDGDGVFEENIFTGLKDLTGLQEVPDNKIEVPTIRNDLWSKFISRLDTPVDLRGSTSLDGDIVTPVEPVDLNLPSQPIVHNYYGYISDAGISYASFVNNTFYQIDFNDVVVLDEIDERYTLPRAENTELPAALFIVEHGGGYAIDLRIVASTLSGLMAASVKDPTDLIDYFIQFNLETPIALSWFDQDLGGGAKRTVFSYNNVRQLNANASIRIYGQANTNSSNDLIISGGTSIGLPGEFQSYLRIVANTSYPSSTEKAFYLHDAFAGVIERIVGRNAFYSEILGRIDTNMRQYASNGCYSRNIIIRGLQIRGYTLSEKPFSVSFNQLWKGADPIFNLGLGYETINGTEYIRLEDKAYFYDTDVSVDISNVRQITREYDPSKIFNKIEVGYTKWQSEDISGLDDPQTKRVYSTRISKIKNTLTIHSDFIAASIAIERTRRQDPRKSEDYKYDNEIFIIAVNDNDVSPDRYQPELAENFDSITGLENYGSRYNSIITPMRNLLRWGNVWNGCLQKYQNSFLKFVSGEGNFDMSSDYSCGSGYQCLGVICDNLSEKQDIPLGSPSNYGTVFGYLHLPELFTIDVINFTWDDYEAIRTSRTNSIRISQTEANHKRFKIKELVYEICKGKCRIVAWPYDEFNISVVETTMPERECGTVPDDCGDNVRLLENSDERITEDGECRVLEDIN